jgi:hypothetical protein
VQSKPGRGERKLEQALAGLVGALHETGIPWMVIGGIAVIARGVRRMTTDIDAVVRGDRTSPGALLRILARKLIVPRIENAEVFAQETFVLLLRHEPTGVEFDVSLAWTAFEHEALDARTDAKYGSVIAPMARPEDLVLYKAFAARPRDIEDATTLLLMYRDIDLARVRRRLGELAALADRPALVVGLEAMIKVSIEGVVVDQKLRLQSKRTSSKPELAAPAAKKPRKTRPRATQGKPTRKRTPE